MADEVKKLLFYFWAIKRTGMTADLLWFYGNLFIWFIISLLFSLVNSNGVFGISPRLIELLIKRMFWYKNNLLVGEGWEGGNTDKK